MAGREERVFQGAAIREVAPRPPGNLRRTPSALGEKAQPMSLGALILGGLAVMQQVCHGGWVGGGGNEL